MPKKQIDFPDVERRLWGGEDLRSIARDLGVGHSTLQRRRREEGYPPAPKHGRRPGTPNRNGRVRRQLDLGWCEALVRAFGTSLAEIGRMWGLSESSVYQRRRAAWLPPARRGARRGAAHRDWKGGRRLDKHGYVLVRALGHPHSLCTGYVREHRLVMERHLGRYLSPREVVHHRNGDVADNRIENLELFPDNAAHKRAEGERRRLGHPV